MTRPHMKILLWCAGSVAARLAPKIAGELRAAGLEPVFHPTASARAFIVESVLAEADPSHAEEFAELSREALDRVRREEPITNLEFDWWISAVRSSGLPLRDGAKALLDAYEPGHEAEWFLTREVGNVRHIRVSEECSAALLAPATANSVAKIVNGITDDFLFQTLRAFPSDGSKPVFIAPAMNTEMLGDPFTKRNLELLGREGFPKYRLLPTASKRLQCGVVGDGALMNVREMVAEVVRTLIK